MGNHGTFIEWRKLPEGATIKYGSRTFTKGRIWHEEMLMGLLVRTHELNAKRTQKGHGVLTAATEEGGNDGLMTTIHDGDGDNDGNNSGWGNDEEITNGVSLDIGSGLSALDLGVNIGVSPGKQLPDALIHPSMSPEMKAEEKDTDYMTEVGNDASTVHAKKLAAASSLFQDSDTSEDESTTTIGNGGGDNGEEEPTTTMTETIPPSPMDGLMDDSAKSGVHVADDVVNNDKVGFGTTARCCE